jgi:hypothetical protein
MRNLAPLVSKGIGRQISNLVNDKMQQFSHSHLSCIVGNLPIRGAEQNIFWLKINKQITNQHLVDVDISKHTEN